MSVESTVAKATQEGIKQGAKIADSAIRKAWSILDAAAQKNAPSEYLSQKAIGAIQGKTSG